MKKLGKLTLNEMQEYAPLSPQEQMGMKGGISKTWLYIGYVVAKELYNEYFSGSGSTTPVVSEPTLPKKFTSTDAEYIKINPDGGIVIIGSDSTHIEW
jgi:hypothetical protein